jgi:O-antigen ligase
VSTNRSARQRVRPLPKGSTLYTPNPSPARQLAERCSARPLLYLQQLPRWVPPVVLAVLLVVGLAVKGLGGAAALCAVAAVLGWLAALSWPRLTAGGRAGRLLTVLVLIAVAGYQVAR